MADNFVTVATFNQTFEAQLARNLLQTEGIEAMLAGEQMADLMFAPASMGDQITLQVREDDAQRATSVLATAAAEARLDEDWEDQAELGAGVWTCSICGEPISNRLSMCYSCQTPRDGIRSATPSLRTDVQREPTTRRPAEAPPPRRGRITADSPSPEEDSWNEDEPENQGDALAHRAFGAAFFALFTVFLLPFSWYYLLRVALYPGELSRKGMRYLLGALLVNGIFILIVFVVALLIAGRN